MGNVSSWLLGSTPPNLTQQVDVPPVLYKTKGASKLPENFVNECSSEWVTHASNTVSKVGNNRKLLGPSKAIDIAIFLLEKHQIKSSKEDAELVLSDTGLFHGYLNHEQFLVFMGQLTKHLNIQVEKNPEEMEPHKPEKIKSKYHDYHFFFSTKGVDGHLCNLCKGNIEGTCYRCDKCDYDICLECVSKNDFDDKRETMMKKLDEVLEPLMELKNKNDLYKYFGISGEENLTIPNLEKQFRILNRDSDSETDKIKIIEITQRNALKETFWKDYQDKEKLITIYKKYNAIHRPIYSHMKQGLGSLLENIYKMAGDTKKEIFEFLQKEKQEPEKNTFFTEVVTYHACLEALIRFHDPACPLLSPDTDMDDSCLHLIGMIMILKDDNVPPDIKRLILSKLLTDEKIPMEIKLLLTEHIKIS